MQSTDGIIRSARLDLVPMSAEFLETALAGDRAGAERLLGAEIEPTWFDEAVLMNLRLRQLRRDPGLGPWLLRAMVRRADRVMVGHIGFHDRPGAVHLREVCEGGVEAGYTVFADYRRNGLATEAATALFDWARAEQGVRRFALSISPTNLASLRLAARLGFVRVGSQFDEIDGPEDVFVRDDGEPGWSDAWSVPP